jgi:hypothetical protein
LVGIEESDGGLLGPIERGGSNCAAGEVPRLRQRGDEPGSFSRRTYRQAIPQRGIERARSKGNTGRTRRKDSGEAGRQRLESELNGGLDKAKCMDFPVSSTPAKPLARAKLKCGGFFIATMRRRDVSEQRTEFDLC